MDWLGDWGGLLDGLRFIAEIIINPFSAYMMKSKLASILVKFVPSNSTDNKQK